MDDEKLSDSMGLCAVLCQSPPPVLAAVLASVQI